MSCYDDGDYCVGRPGPTEDEVACMAVLVAASLTSTCSILRPTSSADGLGGRTVTWATVTASVPCSLRPADGPGSENIEAARDNARQRWTMTVPAGTDITSTDRVLCNGITFDVSSVRTRPVALSMLVDLIGTA